MNERLARDFHANWYGDGGPWRTSWRGVHTVKCPMDLFAYMEIIVEAKPEVIVETGTYRGGSALFFADMLGLVGGGRVVTVDAGRQSTVNDVRITYIDGDSVAMVDKVVRYVGSMRCMVVLDSDHKKPHVLAELDAYAPLVTSGQWLVVEDTNLGRLVEPSYEGNGPGDAVDEWLPAHPEFVQDANPERFGLTMNPGGWLRRS